MNVKRSTPGADAEPSTRATTASCVARKLRCWLSASACESVSSIRNAIRSPTMTRTCPVFRAICRSIIAGAPVRAAGSEVEIEIASRAASPVSKLSAAKVAVAASSPTAMIATAPNAVLARLRVEIGAIASVSTRIVVFMAIERPSRMLPGWWTTSGLSHNGATESRGAYALPVGFGKGSAAWEHCDLFHTERAPVRTWHTRHEPDDVYLWRKCI